METSLHSFLVSVPIAVVLWALMLLAVATAIVLTTRRRHRVIRSAAGSPAEPGPESGSESGSGSGSESAPGSGTESVVMPAVEALRLVDDLRFAREVSVAAERAAGTAARTRARWEVTEQELDDAWVAYEEADAVARRIWAATAFPLLSRRRRLGDNADRERYLHHAATVACRQREISIDQLNDVYAHRGWNPRLHPVVQEAALRNAIRAHRFAGYQQARRRERIAWQNAEIAAAALRSLRTEAAAAFTRTAAEQPAESEFWWAEPWTTGELPVAA